MKPQSRVDSPLPDATLGLSVQPSPITVPAGSLGFFEVQVDGTQGATGTISVQISSNSTGVTFSPSTFTTPAGGGGGNVYVEAAANATGGTISITASYGSLQQSVSIALTIGPPDHYPPVAFSNSDQLVRRDALTPYTGFPPPRYLVYHRATNRFFATDAFLNQLNVVNAATHVLTSTIIIPGAFGLDQSADGSVIYVGTLLGDLYVVDPVHLKILKRYPSATISPYGFVANAVYALADGKLILEQSRFTYVDGNGPLALWDPKTNDITVFVDALGKNGALPEEFSCLAEFQDVLLTNNRTRVLLSPVQTDEGSAFLCSFDPIADTWNWSAMLSGGNNSSMSSFAQTSDGKTLIAYDGYDIYVLDAATLKLKHSIPISLRETEFNYSFLMVSQDDKLVLIADAGGADILDAYDLSTGKQVGWISQVNLIPPFSYTPIPPIYQGISTDGLAAGVIEGGGIGLLDTTAIHALPVGSHFSLTQLEVRYGPASGGTATAWYPDEFGEPAPPLGSVYFGSKTATDLNNDSFAGLMGALSPAGKPGPVDVRAFATDRGSQFLPDAFSYGPWILEAPTTYATAEGGGPGNLYGFAYGPWANAYGLPYIAAPPDIHVTVGGESARVDGYMPNPLGIAYFAAPPTPTNALQYTVPRGVAGESEPITVSTDNGSNTATTKLTYLPAGQRYAVDGQLADGIYDPKRDVYYFTDVSQIRVFSLTKGKWLKPIPIPAPKGAHGHQRLFSLALSPDASKLAVSDPGAIAIYLLDPDKPSSIRSFAYASQIFDPLTEEPSGVAVTDSGTVYFATFDLDGDGGSGYLYSLDPSTAKVSQVSGLYTNASLPTEGPDPSGRLAITADGSRIYFNDAGILGYVDTASGSFVLPELNSGIIGTGDYELAMCANQARLFTEGILTDSNLNSLGVQVLDAAESVDATYIYGAALSADGSLLFQPATHAIDVFDGRTGSFRARVSISDQLSPNFRALVSNNRDSRLVAITGQTGDGIAVIDLNPLPEPAPLPYISTEAAPLAPFRHSLPKRPGAPSGNRIGTTSMLGQRIRRQSSQLFNKR